MKAKAASATQPQTTTKREWSKTPTTVKPASIAILQASDRPPPMPISAVLDVGPHPQHIRPAIGLKGKGIRSLTAAANRAYAGLHGYTYVYARITGFGCGRDLVAWCQIPAVMGLFREMSLPTSKSDDPPQLPEQQQQRPRFEWVLAVDEDVAFNTQASFPEWLSLTQKPMASPLVEEPGTKSAHCRGRCLPSSILAHAASALRESTCPEDNRAAESHPCLIVAKEIGGWPGINVGSRFFRAGSKTLKLLHEWWVWPLRLQTEAERTEYIHRFPGEQNALNDGILTNASLARCVHVTPNAELYSAPGIFARHFTGVSANKEQMFLEAHPFGSRRTLEAIENVPPWNVTACSPYRRTVRLPASSDGSLSTDIEVEYTEHCNLLSSTGTSGELGASSEWAKAAAAVLWPTASMTASGSASGTAHRHVHRMEGGAGSKARDQGAQGLLVRAALPKRT